MEFATSSDSARGYFIIHHRKKWSMIQRLILYAQKQHTIELAIKRDLNAKIEQDSHESHPNY
jgi:hypothetical protein